MDAQSRAYREAGIDDLTSDSQLGFMIDQGALVLSGEPMRTPDEYELAEWDNGREGPKTIQEARAVLRQRARRGIEERPDAYDDLGD